MRTDHSTPRVGLRLGRLDVASWQARHAAGEVPDRWPYGLDRLTGYGLDVTPVPPAGSGRRVARVLRGAGGYEWWEARSVRADGYPMQVCWDERVGVPAARMATGVRRPLVCTGVIWLTDRTRAVAAHRAVAGPGLRACHRVWALSTAQLPVLRDAFGVPGARLRYLPFGIDADFFHGSADPPVPGLVVSAGNDRHRDHPTLLSAMDRVARAVPGARLELATRHEVDLPPRLGVRHAALPHAGMRAMYHRGSVVVVALHPNLHVSGVTVALEAMACGRPVVVTRTPGMAEYVHDGQTGILVPPGDPDALATAVADLLRDPDRAYALGRAGREHVERHHTTEVQARHLAGLLLD